MFALTGCGAPKLGISFTKDEITLYVGETRDLFPYAQFMPAVADDKTFTLNSSGECVTVDGTKVTAVGVGESTVTATASGGTAEIKVTAKYREADRITVEVVGDTVQNLSDIKNAAAVKFTAVLDDYVDPDCETVWTADGEEIGRGRTIEFLPDAFGAYNIAVKASEAEEHIEVKIYRETEAEGSVSGELKQTHDFSAVTFTATEKADSRNPRSVVEWKVNGETRSNSPCFSFVPPSQGEYEVSLGVNGVSRKIDGKDVVTVSAIGERAPKGRVEFDADGTYVRWNDGEARSVSVTSPDGVRTVYSRTDITQSERFSAGEFDATDIIDVCAEVPGTYTLRVSADGNGETFEFNQYGMEADGYIKNKVLFGNSFISTEADAERWISELYSCGTMSAKCYISRDADREKCIESMKARAELLGLTLAVEGDSNVVKASFDAYSCVPTASSTGSSEQILSALPHVEYDLGNLRPPREDRYKFPMERIEKSVAVKNTEQLYLAASCGVRPITEENGALAAVYKRVRNALIAINGRDFDDYQKVHAIHDWLQWTTVKSDDGDAADYIESVFGGSVVSSGAVSSAGMAKTFALMCAFEGIPCEVMIDSGYFWNKVRIDGLWYNVDVFGGETRYVDGVPQKRFELCSHSRLFLTDADMRALGYHPTGDIAFDARYTYLLKNKKDGVYFDYYIDSTEADDKATVQAAVSHAFDVRMIGDILMYTVRTGDYKFLNESVVIELALYDESAQTVNSVTATAVSAAENYCKENGIKIYGDGIRTRKSGNIISIVIHISEKGVGE